MHNSTIGLTWAAYGTRNFIFRRKMKIATKDFDQWVTSVMMYGSETIDNEFNSQIDGVPDLGHGIYSNAMHTCECFIQQLRICELATKQPNNKYYRNGES